MFRKNQLYGLMAGLTAGFAVLGSIPASRQQPEGATGQAYEVTASVRMPGKTLAVSLQETGEQDCPVSLHAQSAVLMDGDSGRVLVQKKADVPRPMASTTKIMTCILALELAAPDTVCTFSSYAAAQPRVHLGAPAGTRFYLKDLLYSLMLESHNDTAVAVAEAVAGSVPEFAALMNRKAEELGCADTHFITPNGLDAEETMDDGDILAHETTAADLARILRYCVMDSPRREDFLAVTQTENYGFSDLSGKQWYSCANHNALLSQIDGVISGKTGFTGNAGYCYVGAYQKEGSTFLLALLGCGWPPHRAWKWEDARALFAYGEEHYRLCDIWQEFLLPKLQVTGGVEESVKAEYPAQGEKEGFSFLLSEEDRVRVHAELVRELCAPVKKGQQVGSIVYELNGEEIRRVPLLAAADVKERTPWYYLRQLIPAFLGRGTE